METKPTKFIGKQVRKHFPGFGIFSGKVVSYDPAEQWFRIRYDDGDEEDVELSDLIQLLPRKGAAKRKSACPVRKNVPLHVTLHRTAHANAPWKVSFSPTKLLKRQEPARTDLHTGSEDRSAHTALESISQKVLNVMGNPKDDIEKNSDFKLSFEPTIHSHEVDKNHISTSTASDGEAHEKEEPKRWVHPYSTLPAGNGPSPTGIAQRREKSICSRKRKPNLDANLKKLMDSLGTFLARNFREQSCQRSLVESQGRKVSSHQASLRLSLARNPPSQQRELLVGLTVQKQFKGHGTFTGQITSYDHRRKYFKILYSDGDEEEMDIADVVTTLSTEQLLGRQVEKFFPGHGTYQGKIISFDLKYKFFKILYEDGDEEEFDLEDLCTVLLPKETSTVTLQ